MVQQLKKIRMKIKEVMKMRENHIFNKDELGVSEKCLHVRIKQRTFVPRFQQQNLIDQNTS